MPDAKNAALDTSPLYVSHGRLTYRVLGRIGVGSVANVYRCTFMRDGRPVNGVFKIVRDGRTNGLLVNEASILKRLHAARNAKRFSAFLPAIETSFATPDADSPVGRMINVLRMHEEVRSPDELYTLAEVRERYPAGLDAREVAWMWRRLLSVLEFVHAQQILHAAVLPVHVLIEPQQHKLLLVDWCCAGTYESRSERPPAILAGAYRDWYRAELAASRAPAPAMDIAMAARCMIDLLGGDPVRVEYPPAVDPAIQRYFGRCVGLGASPAGASAGELLHDFDRLIEALWGPRKFRALTMLPRRGV